MEREIPEIVIATNQPKDALYVIVKDAVAFDELELQFVDKYEPIVEHLLRLLRKGCGWMEQERGKKDVVNKRCAYNDHGQCLNSVIGKIKCSEPRRLNCKKYIAKFKNKIKINFVIIEKAGGIKGM